MRPRFAILSQAILTLLLAVFMATGEPKADTIDPAEPPGKRVALVIGNGAYGEIGRLPNPPNDAGDIATKLRALGFSVTLVRDGNATEMLTAVRSFGVAAAGAEAALFFYAGHGMTVEGENYLIPIGAAISDRITLRYGALALSDVRDTLASSGAELKMVILDACRDNPLAERLQRSSGGSLNAGTGLARMSVESAGGWYIAYATALGAVALDGKDQRNSPFTKALLNHIDDENVDVRTMFGEVGDEVMEATRGAQIPWFESAIRGKFEFNSVVVAPTEPEKPLDYTDWVKIAASDQPSDFEAFLAAHPESDLAGAAQAKLRELRDPARELAAWTALQGSVDPETYEKFLRNYPSGLYAGVARVMLQNLLGAPLLSSNDRQAMEAYLARFPDAALAGPIGRRMADLGSQAMVRPPAAPVAPVAPSQDRALELTAARPDTAVPPEVAPEADLSPTSVTKLRKMMEGKGAALIQFALKALALYNGGIDGNLGPGSQRAVRSFQSSIDAPVTGVLEPVEIVALIGAAARSGDATSQTIYGGLFATGSGVPRDPGKAVEWYRRAAEAGNGFGQLNLGNAYRSGTGVAKDLAAARRWLKAAEANGVREAAKALANLE